ncbi:MAG: glycosyltransferase [Pseudomonadota bacterium]
MKITFVHSGIIPVKTYGGTERVLYWLMKELVARGHQVSLIGNAKSSVDDIGVKLIPRIHEDWTDLIPDGVDVVHLFEPSSLNIEYPYILTVHGNGQPGEKYPVNTVFVSKKHAENHGSSAFVYNGLDLSEYPFKSRAWKSWENFIFLAKASWRVKNLAQCMEVCRSTKKHLYVAGGRAFSLSRHIHSVGMVDQKKKIELLRKMDALIFPVRWHEPFGLAVIEAMAMGLPVISSAYGSLPELVTKETGLLCKDFNELKEAVSRTHNTFSPDKLRKYVETKFSSSVMAENYLSYYKKVISGEKINKTNPEWKLLAPPETLLHF